MRWRYVARALHATLTAPWMWWKLALLCADSGSRLWFAEASVGTVRMLRFMWGIALHGFPKEDS